MLVTDPITFNVRERGRAARGKERNFDTVALARLINSAGVQEKVKHGDMVGYYGHWPRLKFGMEPAEGGIVDGKVVSIDPAIRTVELRAEPDGTITHRAEFLNTPGGVVAKALYQSQTGGFSSAIVTSPNTSPAIPTGFYGFDYVLEPNFTFNRGHKLALDSAGPDAEEELLVMLDGVVGDYAQGSGVLAQLFDSVHAQLQQALAALEKSSQDNEALIAMIAKGGAVNLDSIHLEDARIAPDRHAMPEDWGRFTSMPLATLQALPSDKSSEPSGPLSGLVTRLLRN